MGIPARPGSYNHTPGFTAHAGTREAHERCLAAAKGMGIVGWNVLASGETAGRVRHDFEEDKKIRDLPQEQLVATPVGGCC